MDTVLGSADEGSRDDLCFEDYMAQQEHGARNRYRQVAAHLHYNNNEELDGERGDRGQERLREGSERLSGRSLPQGGQPEVGGSCPLQSSGSPIS